MPIGLTCGGVFNEKLLSIQNYRLQSWYVVKYEHWMDGRMSEQTHFVNCPRDIAKKERIEKGAT